MQRYETLTEEASADSPSASHQGHRPVYRNTSPNQLPSQSTLHPGNEAQRTLYEPQKYGWFEDMLRNRAQARSLAAAYFIAISGGMSFVWSVVSIPDYKDLSEIGRKHLQICWFLAVIIGAFLYTILLDKLRKSLFYLLASLLVSVNGLLFLLCPTYVPVAVIARYCDGLAFGFAVIPTIIVGSERSVKRFRGLVLGLEQHGLGFGMVIFLHFWSRHLNTHHGAFALVLGAAAFLSSFLCTIETPIFYLRQDDEVAAINAVRQVQRPFVITAETHALHNENKLLLEEDIVRGRSLNMSNGKIPMFKLCMFRALVTMSLSIPLSWAYVLYSTSDGYLEKLDIYIIAWMRMMGVLIAQIGTLDNLGRKGLSALSLLIGGGLLIAVGIIFSNYENQTDSIKGLLMAYQVFAGLTAPTCTCYLGEAFSISLKPYFILVAIVCEYVVQIFIFCTFHVTIESISLYGYALGASQIAFAIFFFVGMPETKQTTLREALAKFTQKGFNFGIF